MRNATRFMVALLALLVIGISAWAGGSKESAKGAIKVGVSLPTQSVERWVRDNNYLREEGKKRGVEVLVQIAQDDPGKQFSQIENLIAQGVNVLIIAPHDAEIAATGVAAAKKAHRNCLVNLSPSKKIIPWSNGCTGWGSPPANVSVRPGSPSDVHGFYHAARGGVFPHRQLVHRPHLVGRPRRRGVEAASVCGHQKSGTPSDGRRISGNGGAAWRKIFLVNPLAQGFEQWLFPPLALAALAGAIPENWEVQIADEQVQSMEFEADLAAISANTYSIRRAYELCGEFRRCKVPVILGGNHPTILPEESALHADSVVIGDGETVWPEILADFEHRRLKPIYSPDRYRFERRILPRKDLLSSRYRFDSLETVRGCPLRCDFCSVTRFHGATYRYKPLRLVEAELERVRKKNLFIVDDNLIGLGESARRRVLDLFDLLK